MELPASISAYKNLFKSFFLSERQFFPLQGTQMKDFLSQWGICSTHLTNSITSLFLISFSSFLVFDLSSTRTHRDLCFRARKQSLAMVQIPRKLYDIAKVSHFDSLRITFSLFEMFIIIVAKNQILVTIILYNNLYVCVF